MEISESDPNLSLEKALKGLLQAELEVEKWRLKVKINFIKCFAWNLQLINLKP